MATFPHNLCGIRQDGHAEQHTPVVLRSEVERGMPRQRRTSADAVVSVPCTLVFRSAAAAAEFEAWYYAEGFGWFDFTLPRTGAVVEARIVGGDIGGLTPITPTWNASERSITLEYRRPGFIQLPPGLHSVNPARVLSVQRNSTATYVDDAGLLQTAAANVARWQGGQLLVEGAATNFAAGSSNFVTYWATDGLSTLTNAAATGPSSAMTATRWRRGVNQYLYRQPLVEWAPAGCDVVSLFVKADGWSNLRLSLMGPIPTTLAASDFDLAAGTAAGVIGPAGGIEPLANGWLRISLATGDGTTPRLVELFMLSAPADTGFLLDGFQLEAGSLTSLIPTTTAPATRAADIITVAA